VSANSTNRTSRHDAGARVLRSLEANGWRYHDGLAGPPRDGRWVAECYPYTTLVGAPELGYDTERPTYKRKPRGVLTADWRELRAEVCDDLIQRVAGLRHADPPCDLRSHLVTKQLLDEPSPLDHRAYKHREDLIDAVLCAWSASLWWHHGLDRCQLLGADHGPLIAAGRTATIIAPCRPEQRAIERDPPRLG
jgi:predicted RNase H-like nuclease